MSRLTKFSLLGTVVAALCCFTPILVITFGALGLSWLVGYLDYVLLPLLAIFVIVTIYSLLRKRSLAGKQH